MTPATITEPQFIAALAERGVVVNRSQVNQFRPVASQRGDCRQYGTGRRSVWEWQESAVDVWEKYLLAREYFIECHDWRSKRKYAIEDVTKVLEDWPMIEREIITAALEAARTT